MTMTLMHMHQLEPLYLFNGSNVNPESFGVTGVKRSFSLKMLYSSILHSMTVRLMHINHLETLYIYFGVKCQFGVI